MFSGIDNSKVIFMLAYQLVDAQVAMFVFYMKGKEIPDVELRLYDINGHEIAEEND